MDIPFNHLGLLPRRFPSTFPLERIGYISRKQSWTRQRFSTFNCSFILQGTGRYRLEDRVYRVEAPCVITQWPRLAVSYGPDEWWEELYLVYSEETLEGWRRCRAAAEVRPIWTFDSEELAPHLARLELLLTQVTAPGRVDQIDRVCESLVVDSLLWGGKPRDDSPAEVIERIRTYLDERYAEPIDLETLAWRFGLSGPTFRRHWKRHMPVSPNRYLTQIRINRACQRLAETDDPVGQIARDVGYPDELYFSRRFRQVMNTTATRYRRQQQPGMRT